MPAGWWRLDCWRTLNLRTGLVLVLVCGTSLHAIQTLRRDLALSEGLEGWRRARDPESRRTALLELEVWSQSQPDVSDRVLALMLNAATRDPDPSVRSQALLGLGTLGLRLVASVRAGAFTGARTPTAAELQAATGQLATLEAALERGLEDSSGTVREAAVRAYCWLSEERGRAGGGPPTAVLLRLAADPEPSVRIQALEALGAGLPQGPGVPDVVIRAARDPEAGVRLAALRALRPWWDLDLRTQEAWAALLADADPDVRRYAGFALPDGVLVPKLFVAPLQALLDHPDLELSLQASQRLAAMGTAARSAVPALLRAHTRRATGPDPINWQLGFLRVLAQIDPDGRTVRALRDRWIALLEHEADFLKAGEPISEVDLNRPERHRPLILLDLLAAFGPRSVAALPAARRLARESPDPDVQQYAQALIDQIVLEPAPPQRSLSLPPGSAGPGPMSPDLGPRPGIQAPRRDPGYPGDP